MNGIILYKTRYGSTRQYAEWLRDETGFPCMDIAQCPRDLSGYDTVLLGSSVLAGRLVLRGWIRKCWPVLQGKTLHLFLTHLRDAEDAPAKVLAESLPPEIAGQIALFPVGGRYLLGQMSFLDRTLIRMAASLDKRPEVKAELLTDHDLVDRTELQPLLDRLREAVPA